MSATKLMLGRRPSSGQDAFGHVALNSKAQGALQKIVERLAVRAAAAKPISYDPDDAPDRDEVMVHPLKGIDNQFQPAARWSLERAVKEINKGSRPAYISSAEFSGGDWTFYCVRATVNGQDALAIRATSPSRALKRESRLLGQLSGGEFKPLEAPMIGIDHEADALVIDGKVYIFRPQTLERLLIDAAEIKARAPQISKTFAGSINAKIEPATRSLIEKACSENSNVGRRVERLNRQGDLTAMTGEKLRAGLRDAKLPKTAFGKAGGPIMVGNVDHAIALVDIAADLYYQPRFESNPRKVASFRRLR